MNQTLILLCVLLLPGLSAAKESIKDAVVKIYTVYNRPDYHEPWQKSGQRMASGSGCVIAGKRILTNAHVVSDRTFLQVRKGGEARKYTAQVVNVAHECDLAILKVEDDSFFCTFKVHDSFFVCLQCLGVENIIFNNLFNNEFNWFRP